MGDHTTLVYDYESNIANPIYFFAIFRLYLSKPFSNECAIKRDANKAVCGIDVK